MFAFLSVKAVRRIQATPGFVINAQQAAAAYRKQRQAAAQATAQVQVRYGIPGGQALAWMQRPNVQQVGLSLLILVGMASLYTCAGMTCVYTCFWHGGFDTCPGMIAVYTCVSMVGVYTRVSIVSVHTCVGMIAG